MNRLLLLRRCSMSSIEEEDESITSDELIISTNPTTLNVPVAMKTPEWDSEISESEHEFDGNQRVDHEEEQAAADRALRHFVQSSLRSVSSRLIEENISERPWCDMATRPIERKNVSIRLLNNSCAFHHSTFLSLSACHFYTLRYRYLLNCLFFHRVSLISSDFSFSYRCQGSTIVSKRIQHRPWVLLNEMNSRKRWWTRW